MRKPTKESLPNTLSYKNSAEVVVGVPGCFLWREDVEDSQLNRNGER